MRFFRLTSFSRKGAGLTLEPILGLAEPFGIAQAQVLVADALRAREQRIGELQRRHVEIPLDLLEPFEAVPRRRLQAQHFQPALGLIALEGGGHVRLGMQKFRKRDGAVESKPRA